MSYVSTTVGPGVAALLAGTQTFTGANTFLPTAVAGIGPVTLRVHPANNYSPGSPLSAGQFSPTAIFGDMTPGYTERYWETGPISIQAEYIFTSPQYSAVGSSVMTTAATVAILGAPTAGYNMTITNSYALNVVSGTSRFDGSVICGANVLFVSQDMTATPGPVTIDFPSGRVAVAIGASSVLVTNNLVTATSVVICTLQTVDAGFSTIRTVVPSGGSFTITGDGVAVAAVNIGFIVINPTT